LAASYVGVTVSLANAKPDGWSRCFCGELIDLGTVDEHVYTVHMDLR
jgi:hypothetical protein